MHGRGVPCMSRGQGQLDGPGRVAYVHERSQAGLPAFPGFHDHCGGEVTKCGRRIPWSVGMPANSNRNSRSSRPISYGQCLS